MKFLTMIVTAALVFLPAPMAGAQGLNDEGPISIPDRGRGDDGDRPPLPDPVPIPVSPQGIPFDGYELVGFTDESFAGNRGVLNLSRACGTRFENSRVCGAQEIMGSVRIPEVPGHLQGAKAWIMTTGPESSAIGIEATVTNCHGWSSDSNRDSGLTIELGQSHGCYGAFVPAACNETLVVACCARSAK